jgi:hypothetical protein
VNGAQDDVAVVFDPGVRTQHGIGSADADDEPRRNPHRREHHHERQALLEARGRERAAGAKGRDRPGRRRDR